MQNLLAFLTKYFHWLLFLLLEVASLVLLFSYNSFQGSVWVSSANAVAGKVYEWQSAVEQFFSLQQRTWNLEARNVELEQRLWRARQQLLTMQQDTATVDSALQSATDQLLMLPAKVVSSTLNRPDNLITIDRGRRDGVRPDMGVVSGMGLVGVVYMVSDHYSVLLPLVNTHSRVSCAIRGSGYFGYLMWDGANPTEAYMDDVPRHAQFEEGEWIETSGYSSIFPPGITVGQIASIGNSADGLSYRLKVKLSTDFGCLRDVHVITDTTFLERRQLLMAARDSMALVR
ncbi:MAG: rod shape-determining protein MreC [Prevotella sp.]|nr:rod shape-determining protein MreC [Prevotella sp.]